MQYKTMTLSLVVLVAVLATHQHVQARSFELPLEDCSPWCDPDPRTPEVFNLLPQESHEASQDPSTSHDSRQSRQTSLTTQESYTSTQAPEGSSEVLQASRGAAGNSRSRRQTVFDPACKGSYNRQYFALLRRVCEDCRNLFRVPSVDGECRRDCFSTDTFKQCVVELGLPYKKYTQIAELLYKL